MSENVKKKLPEGWRWVKLGEVCEEKMGLRDPHKQPDTPFYYVDISSVDNNKDKFRKNSSNLVLAV